MPAWIAISEKEGADPEELPTERDGSLLLTSLTNLYPNVTTLKYRGPSMVWRIVRCIDGILTPPEDDGSWGSHVYVCIKKKETPKEDEIQRKRKAEYELDGKAGYDDGQYDADDDSSNWSKSILCSFKSGQASLTENDFRDYFSTFSPIRSINMKPATANQTGTAFIAFSDPTVPMSLYGKDIEINGVPIDVKEPETDDKERRKVVIIFRNEDITKEELREHFEHYGRVTDVYIPQPFKYVGFVTFARERVSRALHGEIHKYKGTELRLQEPRIAKEKREKQQSLEGHWGMGGNMGGMGAGSGNYMGMDNSYWGGGGSMGMRGAGNMDKYGGGYERSEKRQKRANQGGFGNQGRMGGDSNRGHGVEQSANQSWKDMIENFGGMASSGGQRESPTKSWNPDTYGYSTSKAGLMEAPIGSGGLGGPMLAGMMPAGVHADQKPPCPFKLKNPDDKCANFEVCREFYEHGTSYCKYMKRQMDASKRTRF